MKREIQIWVEKLYRQFTFSYNQKFLLLQKVVSNLAIWISVLERDENEVTALNALKDLDF